MRLLVFSLCLVVNVAKPEELYEEVETQCIQNCPLQNRTDKGHYGYACDYNCHIQQCNRGCALWRQALDRTCQEACSPTPGDTPTQPQVYLYCSTGCNAAVAAYFQLLRSKLGTPPAPALLADSLGSTSLWLEWRSRIETGRWAGLTARVQWRYEELEGGWRYADRAEWDDVREAFLVTGLKPYTKYRFRIALLLGSAPVTANATTTSSMSPPPLRLHNHAFLEPILSSESHVISTVAEGPPAAPPRNDIPPESSFLMVRDLKPLRNYTIEIRMRNKRGPGPPSRIIVTTPAAPQSKNVQPPLILGTEHSILELRHILSEPVTIYRCPRNIQLRGIAFHVIKKLLFITDTNGYVSKIALEQDTNTKVDILKPNNLDFTPLDLTVDWLNDQLYIMGKVKYEMSKYRIKRCNFDGSGLTAVYGGLYMKPASIQIDPLNGYLFWTIQDFNKGGLYRLDVSDISNGMKHEAKNILNETELGAFTFEHHNFNILVAFQRLNTIKSVTLDGKEITDVRTSVTTPRLQRVISLAMANKVFYWTDGVDVFNEEYHEGTKNYFHNTIPHLTNGSYRKVFINLQSSQPWPTPINPPTNLQAIFGRDIAKTRWQAPHLVGLQGKGAWQNWSYEISIREVTSGNTTTRDNINNTFFTITNLKENTEYILKVAAYTNSGKSPWSSEFKGSTLNASNNPVILWSAAEGLLKSNAAGENVDTVIDKSDMGDFHFTDITWFKDQIYLVTNNSQVYWFNMTTKEQGLLSDMDSVGSIAVDWIGMKLYWSNPKQQLIIRGNLNGTDQEPLLTVLAKELNIDSTKAYLYWSTGIKVECAHLNGIDRFEYHDVQYFSGKQVMGLTLDMEEKFVYWIVRGSEGSNLYKAPLQGYWEDQHSSAKIVSSLQKPNIQGPLCYFHKRLLWLQDDKNAAISDLSGKNIATINGKHLWGLNMVYVVDPSLYMLPDDFDIWSKINVVPEIVDNSSIRVVGSSESFNVTWKPIKNVNYGIVFYEVQIDSPFRWRNYSTITVTTIPTIKYQEEIAPFTPLIVTVRAFTYWAASPQIRARIFSPPSTPSAPINLRGFVEYERHASPQETGRATVTVRWDPPTNPNGVLQGFKVRCWMGVESDVADICGDVVSGANQTEYKAKGLDDGRIYYFEVQAFTEIGTGTVSEPLAVNSSKEWPIPTLLVASNDSIFIDDIDANRSYSLVEDMISSVELAYLNKENKIFWINQKQEIIMYDTKKAEQIRIFEIVGTPLSLTLDWLERSLYYAESSRDGSFAIYKVDLNELGREPLRRLKILDTNSSIINIEISPFTKTLYWLERTENKHKLMQSYSDGSNVRPFFVDVYYAEDCNCPYFPEVGCTFGLDHSDAISKPLVIFVDLYSQNIVAADKDACTCQVIANGSLVKDSFPMERVEADFATVYWTSRETLYSMRRREPLLLTKQDTVSDLAIYGRHTQPYPPKKCLSPRQYENYQVTLYSKTSDSLVLLMPPVLVHRECTNISMATVRYTVFYDKFDGDMDCLARNQCMSATTMNKTKEIVGLKPFTRYSVWVVVSNYFSDGEGTMIGPPVVFQTAPGVPSKPQNVSATVLSPTLAKVSWLPPEELNGIVVHYEIHWQTDSTLSGVRQKGELSVNNSDVLSTFLNKLSPNETYTVWVRVYSENNETSNDSDRVQITTYPEPSSLLLEHETAYGMQLSWDITQHVERYSIEYALLTSNEWSNIETLQRDNDRVVIGVQNLKPKMHYKFRLSLLYEGNDDLYIWPTDSRFTYETLGDKPSPPGIPIIQYVKPNIYKVFWEASKDNGATIEEYKLEGKELIFYRNKRSTNRNVPYYNTSPSVEMREEPTWMTYYNGTNTSWIISGLDENNKYAFRVSARNSYGWSNTSEESNEFDLNEAARIAEKQSPMNLIIIATGVPISICILVMMGFSYAICSGRGKQKKLQQVVPVPRVPDVELATLRELPRRGVHSTNILYVSTQPTPEELTLLPHIRRDQISLNKFLGSGAFGEVFEGKAKGIDNNNIETKVAVKTLKKGASEQEKSEFLQEAQLMSHFKHEHILQLLGVCLDNDPHFIIMELMEGGDLLTYLRDSRNPSISTPSLNLIELLKMCVDVSKGCRYLEEMHFVHRDLACRNCLVSSFNTEARIVKIGDFGLARDIYKNDYYRKEGEGLLPVRWMAPESLVDGVFTSQSDVWAFGVLLWEIMTLGQQPYPARANLEVLHYVRRGGRLGKPTDCPEDLHKLMLKCWEFEPDRRPMFKYCLEVLEELHRKTLRNPTTGAHEGQYISTVPERNSWKDDADDEKEKTPFLKSEIKEIPKYLELIYEPEQRLENDGYEIPKQMVKESEIGQQSASNSIGATLRGTKDITDLAIHNLLSN